MDTQPIPAGFAEQLRQTKAAVEPAFFQLRRQGQNLIVDAEGYWSYPALIPSGPDTLLWLSLVLTTVPIPDKKVTALFRPKCAVVTKPETCLLVRYDHFRLSHDPFPSAGWDKPVAMFPHRGVAELTYEQFERKEKDLLALYPAAQTAFLREGRLPDEFRQAYLDLIHPIFLPYLNQLAPKFLSALNVAEFVKQ